MKFLFGNRTSLADIILMSLLVYVAWFRGFEEIAAVAAMWAAYNAYAIKMMMTFRQEDEQ